MPSPQSLQASAPATGLNLPAWQLTHGPPSEPDVPGLHAHWVIDELPDGDDVDAGQVEQALSDVAPAAVPYLPAPQSLQASAPATGLNLPAWQLTHGPPPGPDVPGLHAHWVMDELPGGDDDDVGQAEQALSDVAPAAVPYLPTMH